MFPYLRLGPLLIQLPLLALLFGIWLGAALAEKEAARLKLHAATIGNLIIVGLVAGIVGARLGYAARYLQVYLANPLSLVSLNQSTLAGSDGLLIGLAVAAVYGWRKHLPLRPTLDALAPGIAVFLVALGVAHFLSGDAFGAPARLPWSIFLWSEYRHPSQVYETLSSLMIFLLVYKNSSSPAGKGINFLYLAALTAAARIFLEAFRGDSIPWLGGLRLAQVVGLVILAIVLYVMPRWCCADEPGTEPGEISDQSA